MDSAPPPRRTPRRSAPALNYDESLSDELLPRPPKRNRTLKEREHETRTEALIALSLGFPIDALLPAELAAAAASPLSTADVNNYIVVRNHILARWRANVRSHLSIPQIRESVSADYDHLISAAFSFLSEHGYINFVTSRTAFAFNSLIRAHSNSPTPLHSFHFNRQLLLSHLRPDHFSLTFLARAAASSAHAAALRRGLAVDPHVATALIHAYAAHTLISSAQLFFSTLRNPDHVARTALLLALIAVGDEGACNCSTKCPTGAPLLGMHRSSATCNLQSGRQKNTLSLFEDMLAEGARITDATLALVLTACVALGSLEQGRWVHAYIRVNRLLMNVIMRTVLIDMYSKCGEMALAMDVFWIMQERNVCEECVCVELCDEWGWKQEECVCVELCDEWGWKGMSRAV